MNYCEVKVVIGSWGSYNACNERALGSSWIDFSDYSDWSEIDFMSFSSLLTVAVLRFLLRY